MNKNEIVNAINSTKQGKRTGLHTLSFPETRDLISTLLGVEPTNDTENIEHKRYCVWRPHNNFRSKALKVELWERDTTVFALYVGKQTDFYKLNEKRLNNADILDANQGKDKDKEVRNVIPKNAVFNILGAFTSVAPIVTKKAEKQDKKQA